MLIDHAEGRLGQKAELLERVGEQSLGGTEGILGHRLYDRHVVVGAVSAGVFAARAGEQARDVAPIGRFHGDLSAAMQACHALDEHHVGFGYVDHQLFACFKHFV